MKFTVEIRKIQAFIINYSLHRNVCVRICIRIAEGMIKYLDEQGWQTENAVFLNAWEPAEIRNKNEYTRIDATSPNDSVQFLSKPAFGNPDIPNSDYKIRIKSDENILYIHRDLINGNCQNLWDTIKEYLAK